MNEQACYYFLKSLMPELQFLNPYTDDVPLPVVGSDFATFNLMPVTPKGWSQRRQKSYNSETGQVTNYRDINRIYRVQLDFYGPNAFENAITFQQTLEVNLTGRKQQMFDLKKISEVRNLTFLQENKSYIRRYNFDVELFAVDTIEDTAPVIERATVKIINRGNNFN